MKGCNLNIIYHQHNFGTVAVYTVCHPHEARICFPTVIGFMLAIVFQLLTFGLFLILLTVLEWLRAKCLLSTSEQAGFRPHGVS